MAENKYCVEYSKNSRARCKDTKCKGTINADSIRIGKVPKNPCHEGEESATTHWYHLKCIFSSLKRARKTTKKIESEEDLEGFDTLKPADQDQIRKLITENEEEEKNKEAKKGTKRKKPEEKTTETTEKTTETKSNEKKEKKPRKKEEIEAEDFEAYLTADSGGPKGGLKFWSIKVEGTQTTTTYGKVGGKPTTKPKTHESAEKATKVARREVKKKEAKGYSYSVKPTNDGEEGAEKKPKKAKSSEKQPVTQNEVEEGDEEIGEDGDVNEDEEEGDVVEASAVDTSAIDAGDAGASDTGEAEAENGTEGGEEEEGGDEEDEGQ